MYKNLLFDMDMTILDFNMAERQALSGALQHLGVEPEEEILKRYNEINLSQWKLLEKGELTREELKVRRFRLLFEEMGIDIDPKEGAANYEPRLAQGSYYMEGARELLEKLQGQYAMYIVSNGTASIQHSRIAGADLAKYFDDIFISEEVGYNKPDQRFFDACFKTIEGRLGQPLNLEETVIIGDSLSSDIQGGNRVGLDTIWFNPKGEGERGDFNPQGEFPDGMRPTYEIRTLEQLPLLLQMQ